MSATLTTTTRDAADAPTADFLQIEALDKVYPSRSGGVTALKNVSFAIGAAEFVSLLGPSGCGKSTLLRCVGGLDRASPTAKAKDQQAEAPCGVWRETIHCKVFSGWLEGLRRASHSGCL